MAELESQSGVEAVVGASYGDISNVYALRVVGTPRWRAFFDLDVEGEAPVDLRCYLRLGDTTLTETWLYQHHPGHNAAWIGD